MTNEQVLDIIKDAVDDDIEYVVGNAADKFPVEVEIDSAPEIKIEPFTDDNYEECYNIKLAYDVHVVDDPEKTATVEIEYDVLDGEIYYPLNESLDTFVNTAYHVMKRELGIKPVRATTVLHTQKITAAGEEENTFVDDIEEEDEDAVTDAIDDVSDQIEDLQDQVDEVDEDTVDIEIENNIDGHYIAECDVCHGVFISAMIESDEDVECISGVCPLCQKESDQYLKWLVKAVDKA